MPELNESDLDALRERLSELGRDAVAVLLAADGFPTTHRLAVARWLADQASASSPPASRRRTARQGEDPSGP